MATRQIKMPVKDGSEQEVEEVLSQRKRPERGRFLLQVDRQTKGSYDLGSRSGGCFGHQKEASDCEGVGLRQRR